MGLEDGNIKPQLTMGPVLFNWHSDIWRDFYFRVADEAPVDTVYIGEIVCFKRCMLFLKVTDEVVARLKAAGKKVVYSALALAMNDKSVSFIENVAAKDGLIEANDMTAVSVLTKTKKPFAVGPYINTYNEGTLASFAKQGACHVSLPFEMDKHGIKILAEEAGKQNMTSEVMVYGRTPLAIAARCYHARLHDKDQQGCQFVCMEDPEGVKVSTMTDQDFLIVNGKQTLSHSCTNLVREMPEMIESGVTHFRLSPHSGDMVKVAEIFRDVMTGKKDAMDALPLLEDTGFNVPFANGYYHGEAGHLWVG